jgi:glycosyltransferase 2 family protein
LNPKLKQAVKFLFFFGLGVGLLWWQYAGFTPEQKADFINGIRHANYFWVAVAVFVGALAHLSRAIRWQQLLTPLGHSTPLGNRFFAVMIAYLANYAFPRLGEVSRCGLMKRSDNVPFEQSFGTVVAERLIDTLCLALVFVLTLLFQFDELGALSEKWILGPASAKFQRLLANQTMLIIVISIIVIGVAAFLMLRKRIAKLISGKIGGVLQGFWKGIKTVREVPQPFWFIFHSLFIWFCYLISLYCCLFCFPETSTLGLNQALVLLLFGTFGVVFTPGGIGAYQLIITAILTELVASAAPAAASFAWISWGAQVLTVVIFTGISYLLLPILNRRHVNT